MDLRELYQELIVDHSKQPRNFGSIKEPDYYADGFNPLCGDKVRLYLKVDNDVITQVKFEGSGCAISTASASVMTEMLCGQTIDQAEALFKVFHSMVTGSLDSDDMERISRKLAVFSGVKDYPARVKCATLAWHTLHNALVRRDETAKTE